MHSFEFDLGCCFKAFPKAGPADPWTRCIVACDPINKFCINLYSSSINEPLRWMRPESESHHGKFNPDNQAYMLNFMLYKRGTALPPAADTTDCRMDDIKVVKWRRVCLLPFCLFMQLAVCCFLRGPGTRAQNAMPLPDRLGLWQITR